ncbi:MAG: trypsin-like peptidase domain-containing protein [Acidobacteria bacterium]|nr:trypsin-like peptidase domain-containing protein [Acidobacteriota bacterium]
MLAILATAVVLAVASPASAERPVIIGEHVYETFETPHPYPTAGPGRSELTWFDEVSYPGATYIAVHFGRFELGAGDRVVVRTPDGSQSWTYTGLGRGDMGKTPAGFFATHVNGDRAIVELYSAGSGSGYGYRIDYYGRGYNNDELEQLWARGLGEKMNLAPPPSRIESVCGADDTEEAKCYQVSEPAAYDKARAVARLTLNGNAHCTGWLVGCEGHIITNQHCIGSQSELNNIDFEFMAEGPDCATNCATTLGCPGTIEASGGTLVQVDAPLDYALVMPDTTVGGGTDLPATYGYMQLRDSGAVDGERIYIPQHPAGWGKRIAVESTHPVDTGGLTIISGLTEPACATGGPPDVGYFADTQGGSSGSPVLAYSDNKIVALHHCRGNAACTSTGGDPNRGVPIQNVIADLDAQGNVPNCAVCDPPELATSLSATVGGDNQIDLAWTGSAGATSYNVYRALGACPGTGYQLVANTASTSYSDTTVSGSVTYSYVVTAVDDATGCESDFSVCADATGTGTCTEPPAFAGLDSATSAGTSACAVELSWSAGSPFCSSPSAVVYNVYRSTTSGFTPDNTTLLAACQSGTFYSDDSAISGIEYFYVVRAEDTAGSGSGICGGGAEDTNTGELAAVPSGPDTIFLEDDMEGGGAAWTTAAGTADSGSTPWALVTSDSHSPVTSWSATDQAVVKDQWLITASAVSVPAASETVLSFWHRFNLESGFDGGVLEISTDAGATWQDILAGNAGRFLVGGYNSTISTSFNSPIAGRDAWSANSGGWTEVQVDLSDFAGQDVLLRWRIACDVSVSAEGWFVDDVLVFYGSECTAVPGDDLLFEDSFEGGDFSAWDGSGGDITDLSVTAAAFLAGTSLGMAVDVADLDDKYLIDDLPADQASYHARFYFDPNSLVLPHNKRFKIFQVRASDNRRLLTLVFREESGSYVLLAKSHQDDGTWAKTPWIGYDDNPHYVEVEWTQSSAIGANDGRLRMWIDGALVSTVTGIDNDERGAIDARFGEVGGLDAGTSGTFYLDHFEARKLGYIGQ